MTQHLIFNENIKSLDLNRILRLKKGQRNFKKNIERCSEDPKKISNEKLQETSHKVNYH